MDERVRFMNMAIKQAEKAFSMDEVPVGAVIVLDGKVLAKACNSVEKTQDATAHAELIAIRKACAKLKSWRLSGAEMFVTLEPCPMCAGAIVNARIKTVYFGAKEPKSGCAESKYHVLTDNGLNHSTEFSGGVEEKRCSLLIKEYFAEKRRRAKAEKTAKENGAVPAADKR